MLSQLPNSVTTEDWLIEWQVGPRLTFSQGLLKEVVFGLKLSYQVPAFQILFHFLLRWKERREDDHQWTVYFSGDTFWPAYTRYELYQGAAYIWNAGWAADICKPVSHATVWIGICSCVFGTSKTRELLSYAMLSRHDKQKWERTSITCRRQLNAQSVLPN